MEKAEDGPASVHTKEPKASFCAAVVRDLFLKLPKEERDAIAGRAKEELVAAKDAYLKALKEPPSKTPEAHQKSVIFYFCWKDRD